MGVGALVQAVVGEALYGAILESVMEKEVCQSDLVVIQVDSRHQETLDELPSMLTVKQCVSIGVLQSKKRCFHCL